MLRLSVQGRLASKMPASDRLVLRDLVRCQPGSDVVSDVICCGLHAVLSDIPIERSILFSLLIKACEHMEILR